MYKNRTFFIKFIVLMIFISSKPAHSSYFQTFSYQQEEKFFEKFGFKKQVQSFLNNVSFIELSTDNKSIDLATEEFKKVGIDGMLKRADDVFSFVMNRPKPDDIIVYKPTLNGNFVTRSDGLVIVENPVFTGLRSKEGSKEKIDDTKIIGTFYFKKIKSPSNLYTLHKQVYPKKISKGRAYKIKKI